MCTAAYDTFLIIQCSPYDILTSPSNPNAKIVFSSRSQSLGLYKYFPQSRRSQEASLSLTKVDLCTYSRIAYILPRLNARTRESQNSKSQKTEQSLSAESGLAKGKCETKVVNLAISGNRTRGQRNLEHRNVLFCVGSADFTTKPRQLFA